MHRLLKPVCASVMTLCVVSQDAIADPWFSHEFGELRSYHGDWLNVCSDNGAGPCRTVQYVIGKGETAFFGESRIALLRQDDGTYVVEFFDRGMPTQLVGDLTLDFRANVVAVAPAHYQMGGAAVPNLLETVTLDGVTTATLIPQIKAKRVVTIRYMGPSGEMGDARFSLRGVTAALRAIEDHIETRVGS